MKCLIVLMVLSLAACGKNGTNGATGATGVNGASGAQGIQGPQGVAGTNGTNASCSVSAVTNPAIAPNGGSLITCSDGSNSVVLNGATGAAGVNGSNGTNGVNGTNGTNGTAGTNGTNGVNGTNGTNGTVITPVQFCKGLTPTYPSSFPESGVCIGGVMYGVYSANDGFLAELPAGTYSSNGINASCTFTIGANCSVQ